MKLTKTSITYKGKKYPCIEIHYSQRDMKALDEDLEYRTFASRELADDMGYDDSKWDKETANIDDQIDYYMATGEVERFHEGKTKVADMKAEIKDIVKNWW